VAEQDETKQGLDFHGRGWSDVFFIIESGTHELRKKKETSRKTGIQERKWIYASLVFLIK
jgi:hypothetical protein